jgi:hypothetical protein
MPDPIQPPHALDYQNRHDLHPSRVHIMTLLVAAFALLLAATAVFLMYHVRVTVLNAQFNAVRAAATRPSLGPAAARARSEHSLLAIGSAITHYQNDFGGSFPDSFPTLLIKENLAAGAFIDPARSDTPATGPTPQAIADQLVAGGHCSYVYLGAGLNMGTLPPNVVVAYEIPTSPAAGANVLLTYGNVQYLDANHLANIIAQAAAGTFPVTVPSP